MGGEGAGPRRSGHHTSLRDPASSPPSPSTGPSPTYWELTIPVTPETAEGLTNFLWELGALGVVEEEAPPGVAPRLRAFFPETAAPAALGARADAYLASLTALGFDGGGRSRVAPLMDPGWAEAWRAHFRPAPVGRSLLVAPPWENAPAADGRIVVTIEPGRAFGTGQHGSTAGCLILLERLLDARRPARMLDVGTGSGILAVAAARLGVASVLAVDCDPDAVSAARANAALNGVADRVRCEVADAAALEVEPAPLVVANLRATAHAALAGRYPRLVTEDGVLVLGGLLDAEASPVGAALEAHGFRPRESVAVDGWTSLALDHAPLHAGP